MAGVYYAAAELSKLGFIVTPTSRNAQGIDLLIANSSGTRSYSAQVKSNATTFGFWLLGEKNLTVSSETLFYIFVNMRKTSIEYYIVPSNVVANKIKTSKSTSKKTGKLSTWYEFHLTEAKNFQNKWLETFGDPK